jgi:hypothetical protein
VSTIQNFATITPENFKMSPATLESPALEFDFDTLGLDLLALDAPDDQPGESNIDQGNELPQPFHPSSHPNPEVLFTDNQMFTIEDDEPPALEAEPLSPLQLPASIPAAMEAALEPQAESRTSAPAPCDPPSRLTRRQELTEEIEGIESQVVEYSETEYELAEKVSQVRKWRKEALENLRALKWQLNAMSDEDADKPAFEPAAQQSQQLPPGSVTITARVGGKAIDSVTLTGKAYDTLTAYPPTSFPTSSPIDHGGAQSLTALGVTPKQLEKFEIEGIRTVSQFERALADRSIENVRGIQERTMDKLREALWEFRKQHPIPDPDDRPVLTASERDAKMEATQIESEAEPQTTAEATEATPEQIPDQPTPKPSAIIGSINLATDPLNAPLAGIIMQAGRDARTAGFSRLDNPLRTGASVHREELWNDGWDEEDQQHQEIAKRLANGAKGEPSEAAGEATGDVKATKKHRTRKPKAKAGETDGTEATKPE